MLILPHKAFVSSKSLLPTDYRERGNPLNPFPPSKIERRRTLEGRLPVSIIGGQ